MSDTFLRDLRIGLRVLVKEKAFCALATIVLALGICGVTTMFSVVNGVMLRGFSFPNADRLASANFVDPTTATFFGVNGQITAMDFNELLPMQKSFEMMSAYLNGSTVNVTVERPAAAIHRRVYDRALPENPRRVADQGPRLRSRRQPAGRRKSGAHRLRHLAARLRRRRRRRRARRADQWQAGDDHRRHAARLRVSGERGAVDSALQRVPAAAAQRSGGDQPGGPRSAQEGRLGRPGDAGVHEPGAALCRGLSGDEQALQRRSGPDADRELHAAAAARHAADDARVLRRRVAHRLRERDEHAVRPGDASRPRARDPVVARRQPRAARPPDADRKPAPRRHRRRRRHRARVCGDRLAGSDGPEPRQSAAVLDHVRHVAARPRGDVDRDDRLGRRLRAFAGDWLVTRARRRSAARQRARQHQLSREPAVAKSGGLPDRHHLRAAHRRDAAAAIDRQTAEHRLRLRHGRPDVGAYGPHGRRLSLVRRAQAVLRPAARRRCARTRNTRPWR